MGISEGLLSYEEGLCTLDTFAEVITEIVVLVYVYTSHLSNGGKAKIYFSEYFYVDGIFLWSVCLFGCFLQISTPLYLFQQYLSSSVCCLLLLISSSSFSTVLKMVTIFSSKPSALTEPHNVADQKVVHFTIIKFQFP